MSVIRKIEKKPVEEPKKVVNEKKEKAPTKTKVSSELSKKAEENATVSLKTGKIEEPIKEGIPLEHTNKHKEAFSSKVVGMSKGLTKNMGDYQSARFDVWISDVVGENETVEQALDRLSAIIDLQLEKEVEAVLEDNV